MARKRSKAPKPEEDEFPPPLNMSEDFEDLKAHMAGCTTISQDPLVGTFTVVTRQGHYDFLINETLANEMIQALREFIAGDSVSLLVDE